MKIIEALNCQNRGRPPLWLMRQAGRCLPEYRALRAKHDFLTLCKTPELIREVTLQPLNRFGFDAAILFSDILVIPDSMGLGLSFEEAKGPLFAKTLNSKKDIEQLTQISSLDYVIEGIKLIKKELDRPLLGFAGAPFTVASYMIEGGSSKNLAKTLSWLKNDSASFHLLLDKIAEATASYLNKQIEAGVAAVQLFDSWASYLNSDQFAEFSLSYLKKIKSYLPAGFPLIFFSKGKQDYQAIHQALPTIALSVDSSQDLAELRAQLGPNVALQGNLDPKILLESKEEVVAATQQLLVSMKKGIKEDGGWIFNLGHGVLPQTPLENLYALRDTVFDS